MTTIIRRKAPRSPAISLRLLRIWGDAMLERVGRAEAELSVLLTNDKVIQQLNRDYRAKDRPTDVLSFHFDAGEQTETMPTEWLLGDIVISLDTAQRQARGRRRPLEEEVRWLLAHGVLHLCGFDHSTRDEKREMVAWTRRLIRAAELASASSKRRMPLKKRHPSKSTRLAKPARPEAKPSQRHPKRGRSG